MLRKIERPHRLVWMRIALAAALLPAIVVACSSADSTAETASIARPAAAALAPPAGGQGDDGSQVIARIDGDHVTMAELRAFVSGRLAEVWNDHDAEVYRLRRQALEEIMVERGVTGAKVYLSSPITRSAIPLDTTSGRAFGPPEAPVQVVVFQDYHCPYCRRHEQSLAALRQKHGQDLRVEYRDFPLSIHPRAQVAALAARCGGKLGRFAEVHAALFDTGSDLDVTAAVELAASNGVDREKFAACMDDSSLIPLVQEELALGQNLGVSGTPASFINGVPISGAVPVTHLAAIIETELLPDQFAADPAEAEAMIAKGVAAVINGKTVTIAELDERTGGESARLQQDFNSRLGPVLLQVLDQVILERLKPKHEIEIVVDWGQGEQATEGQSELGRERTR